MSCFGPQTSFIALCDQNNDNSNRSNANLCNSPTDLEIGPLAAQFILFTSLQKLDQAKRSRGGIRLRRGLLIAVTALKAKQLLWQQQDQYTQLKLFQPSSPSNMGTPVSLPPNQPLPVTTVDSFHSFPPLFITPLRDSGQVQTIGTNRYCTSGQNVKMDVDNSPAECISGPPCFPPSPDELLQDDEEESPLFQPITPNANAPKRIRLDYDMLEHATNPNSNSDVATPTSTTTTRTQSCYSSCVGIG